VPLTPQDIGRAVVNLVCDPAYRSGTAFGISDRGLATLEHS
jgi:hypothetical protein